MASLHVAAVNEAVVERAPCIQSRKCLRTVNDFIIEGEGEGSASHAEFGIC